MTNKIEVIFVSKDDKFASPKNFTSEFHDKHPDVSFVYIENNKLSLATVYNSFIEKHREAKDVDYLVFMHADVFLDFEHFVEHLNEVKGKYAMIGLAGCQKMSVSQSPLNWFCASNPFPESRYGCVTHGELQDRTSFFNENNPDVTDKRVACIDGLCMILSKKLIEETDFLFDDQFMFNQYDTDASLQVVMKYKLPLGVIVEKSLNHHSVGRQILEIDFLKDELKLRNKWKFEIPQSMKEKLGLEK